MKITVKEKDIIISEVSCLNVELCFFCGQAFRWKKTAEGGFHGVVKGKVCDIIQTDSEIIFKNTTVQDFESIWQPYFDLDRDYPAICDKFSADGYLSQAVKEYYGIRILRQEPWEALCSFIISQNNNIPRITGIISRLCESFGEKIGEDDYTFPTYQRLSSVSLEELSSLRAGFRAKYILDAVQKLESGEISLEKIAQMDIEQSRQELMKIKGVGKKVAECTLLYGFGRMDAFPEDVWVKRIMAEMYPDGLPKCTEKNEGIAQQYLFHWRRNSPVFEGGQV